MTGQPPGQAGAVPMSPMTRRGQGREEMPPVLSPCCAHGLGGPHKVWSQGRMKDSVLLWAPQRTWGHGDWERSPRGEVQDELQQSD